MKSQTPGYLIVPPASAAKVPEYRVVAPGLRLVCRAKSIEAAEIIAALDSVLTERDESDGCPLCGKIESHRHDL